MAPFSERGMTGTTLILLVTAFLVVTGNWTFFSRVLETYPPDTGNWLALLSVVAFLAAITIIPLACLAFWRATKPVLIAALLVSASSAHFMDGYGIVISAEMVQNVSQTNLAEARDLISFNLILYLAVLGIAPAFAVARANLQWHGLRTETLSQLKLLLLALLALASVLLAFYDFYASFGREHKPILSYANPVRPLYAAAKHIRAQWAGRHENPLVRQGEDAHIPAHDTHRELVILVVGETARADHFSLNGYARDTNPRLRQAGGVLSFGNFRSCGTATVVSVPCMFSLGGQKDFVDMKQAASRENLLDVLQHAGVNVLWLDNNSDSKGVALRVPYRSYMSSDFNTICDTECRDEGMLVPLQGYIDAHPKGDIVIVLHQMGNHGPAYFRRYPPAFEKFKPACQSSDLSRCTREEINNAYDNALLYTDHFLAKAIDLLGRNDDKFETALFYASDHGESLGERGIYLHGLPRTIAPEAQRHVPAIMWFGRNFKELDVAALAQKRDEPFTHDNFFHTVLGFLEIESSVYRPEMDILKDCRKPESG